MHSLARPISALWRKPAGDHAASFARVADLLVESIKPKASGNDPAVVAHLEALPTLVEVLPAL